MAHEWVFSSVVWSFVSVSYKRTLPSLEGIKRNAHHIQSHVLAGDIPLPYYVLQCTRLTSVKNFCLLAPIFTTWTGLALMLSRSRDHQLLTLHDPSYTTSSSFWDVLSRCQKLSVNIDFCWPWPSVDLIKQNAHHIRHLSYSSNISLPWCSLTFPYLVSLKIFRPPMSDPILWSLLSKQVLESHHTLRFIGLYELGDTPPSKFWLALGRCQNFKKLHIYKVEIDSQDFETFNRSCLRLQDLRVSELSINGP
ncbi:MAG: hypothetical protein BYD32DRAFT_485224 [Podila humilis]|nr:MAG: hypothetical protein BYD32DRAFT_485224 [Podila humilis]